MAEARILKRNEVLKENTWAVEDIFPTDQAWSDEYEALKALPEKAAAFTDFFILDAVPPAGWKRKVWYLKLHILQGMMKKNVDYSRFNLKNKIMLFGTHILGLPFSTEWKAKMYEKISTQNPPSNEVCMSNGAFGLGQHIWNPEMFRKKITVKFEDVDVLIPARYDEVLTVLFGPDYMTPPPVEERVAKHLDL